MTEKQICFYDFGSFRLDALKRQLLRDGEILPLTSKAFATLLILIERRGEVVTKEALMDAVWCDTAVEENNLTQQISTLRKALGERIRTPQFIITIPGRGYSFVAPVEEIFNGDAGDYTRIATNSPDQTTILSGAQPLEPARNKEAKQRRFDFPKLPPRFQSMGTAFLVFLLSAVVLPVLFFSNSIVSKQPVICILPFKSLNNNEKSNIYGAGIPSYVTAKIGNLPNMIVRAPAGTDLSGKYYGQEQQNVIELAQENNVDAVLTGSTFCEGESVQVIVHLWDVKNKRQIWAKVFVTNAAETLKIQESISEEIIDVLRAELTN